MDGLKSYREKIKSIEELVDKLESGELSIHELVELETLTRDLHERSIILKYKAFENRVEAENSENEESQSEEPVIDEETIDLVEDVIEEAEEAEEPVFDFAMFDAAEEEANVEEEQVVEEAKEEVQSLFEPTPEPIVEEEPVVEVEETPESTIPEPIAEEPKVVVKEKGTSFLDRLSIADNSISSQLAGRKIDTLSGAFGINDRLLYINELFDGSGEAFSDAVKVLDSQPSLDEASNKVEELAFQNSWNPEEEVVLEFLAIIKRRYA